jgi:hypothetical protein
MARAANYDVVTDALTSLGAGAGQTPLANLDLGFAPEIAISVRSVLSYMVAPGPSGMTFKMSVVRVAVDGNDSVVLVVPSTALPSHIAHVRQEVIDANVLQGANIRLRIEVTSGSGSFSDIVLWYQSDV